jgi:hypothetical protein
MTNLPGDNKKQFSQQWWTKFGATVAHPPLAPPRLMRNRGLNSALLTLITERSHIRMCTVGLLLILLCPLELFTNVNTALIEQPHSLKYLSAPFPGTGFRFLICLQLRDREFSSIE